MKKLTQEDYLLKLQENNILVKPIDKYKTSNEKINHLCICGEIFEGKPNKVLQGLSCGCKKTNMLRERNKTKSKGKILTKEEYLNKLDNFNIKTKLVGNYINASTKVEHLCICGNTWEIEPKYVLKNNTKCGCGVKENKIELYKNRKTILYYIKVNNIYKIGICLFNKNIDNSIYNIRFGRDIKKGIKIEIIKTKIFNNGSEAFLKEQEIISKYSRFKYFGESILLAGNTELFSKKLSII